MQTAPSYHADLFEDDAILNPYGHYTALRDAGAAVWLPRHELWAIPRFDGVRHALRNTAVFSSAHGVAANDTVNAISAGTTLASDPPLHEALRRIIVAPLRPVALADIRPQIEAEAEALVERLVARGRFDAVTDLAQHLPLSIVSDLVGLPEAGRERMLEWAAATFDVLGVLNARGTAALGVVQGMRDYVLAEAVPGKLRPGSWGARIHDAAARGEVAAERCPALMRDYLGPSLDTTIFAIANLMLLLGRNPDQWDLLRADPSLVPAAVNEALRVESPIRAFTRLVTRDHVLDGVTLPAGSRALLLYASANRDERKWAEPERFDIRRPNADHLGFGHGIHLCAGMHLARLEIHALLAALVTRVRRFAVGEPEYSPNNVLRGLARLDVIIH